MGCGWLLAKWRIPRSVSMCVFVGVGSRYETDEEAGLSHFLEHMVFKGTAARPEPQQISAAIEGCGRRHQRGDRA